MRRNIRTLIAAALLAAPSLAWAQIDPTVEVEREFDVKLVEIEKPSLQRTDDSSLGKFNVNFNYSVYEKPYGDLYEFVPHRYVTLEKPAKRPYQTGFIKLGVQYPWVPSAQLAIQKVASKGFSFSLGANHNSAFSALAFPPKEYDIESRSLTDLDLTGKYAWSSGTVKLDLYGNDRRGTWNSSGSSVSRLLGARLSAGSVSLESDGFMYNVSAGFSGLSFPHRDRMPADFYLPNPDERILDADAIIGVRSGKRFLYLQVYNRTLWSRYAATDAPDGGADAGLFGLAPQVEYVYKGLTARIGLNVEFDYLYRKSNDENSVTMPVHPIVDLQYMVLKNKLWLRGYLVGGNSLNTLTDADSSMEWFPRCKWEPSYSTTAMKAGLEVKALFFDRLSVSLSGDYSNIRNQPFWQLYGTNYVLSPSDARVAGFGAEILWKSKSLTAGGNFFYNDWLLDDEAEALLKPRRQGTFFARYNYREHFVAEAGFNARSAVTYSRDPETTPADGWWDVYLQLSYVATSRISIYGRVNNLLNQQVYYAPTFLAPSFNLGLGISYKF